MLQRHSCWTLVSQYITMRRVCEINVHPQGVPSPKRCLWVYARVNNRKENVWDTSPLRRRLSARTFFGLRSACELFKAVGIFKINVYSSSHDGWSKGSPRKQIKEFHLDICLYCLSLCFTTSIEAADSVANMNGDAHSFLAQAGSALLSLTPQTSNAWKKRPLLTILTHIVYKC